MNETIDSKASGGVTIRGSDRWTSLLGGIALFALGTAIYMTGESHEAEASGWFFIILGTLGCWSVFKSIRDWHRPYVRFERETLVIFDLNRPQYISRAWIVSFSSYPHKTVLRMKDGLELSISHLPISHLPFVTSRQVALFKQHLHAFLEERDER